ncbi:primase C-terminal domain-containing protein, partial [Klebsiella pneumoniae]
IRQGWPEYNQWLQACYERASAYNLQFAAPLDENEVSGIAKSIAKWTIKNFSENEFNRYVKNTHTKEIQSIRGKKGGAIGGVLSRGGGRPLGVKNKKSISSEKPWLKSGVSRSTWYRKLKNV